MQADAIPDWFIYILGVPIFPLGFAVNNALGILQCSIMLIGIAWSIIMRIRQKKSLLKCILAVYVVSVIVPNIAVVVWGILTDPCL